MQENINCEKSKQAELWKQQKIYDKVSIKDDCVGNKEIHAVLGKWRIQSAKPESAQRIFISLRNCYSNRKTALALRRVLSKILGINPLFKILNGRIEERSWESEHELWPWSFKDEEGRCFKNSIYSSERINSLEDRRNHPLNR